MHPLIRFANRHHAGTQLARALRDFSGRTDVIVLALPRGGVPVARPIADMLQVPLDVWVVRKLGAPGHEELALGALAEGGATVSNTDLMRTLGVTAPALADVASREQVELQRRVALYRRGAPPPPVRDRTVILVDDGLATGATMEAAIAGVRRCHPAQIVVAAPVGAPDTCRRLETVADRVVCLSCPPEFGAVGQWYDDFRQTGDADVIALLQTPGAE